MNPELPGGKPTPFFKHINKSCLTLVSHCCCNLADLKICLPQQVYSGLHPHIICIIPQCLLVNLLKTCFQFLFTDLKFLTQLFFFCFLESPLSVKKTPDSLLAALLYKTTFCPPAASVYRTLQKLYDINYFQNSSFPFAFWDFIQKTKPYLYNILSKRYGFVYKFYFISLPFKWFRSDYYKEYTFPSITHRYPIITFQDFHNGNRLLP